MYTIIYTYNILYFIYLLLRSLFSGNYSTSRTFWLTLTQEKSGRWQTASSLLLLSCNGPWLDPTWLSIDWFKGKITGKSHDLHEKIGMVSGVDFPLSQAIDHWNHLDVDEDQDVMKCWADWWRFSPLNSECCWFLRPIVPVLSHWLVHSFFPWSSHDCSNTTPWATI